MCVPVIFSLILLSCDKDNIPAGTPLFESNLTYGITYTQYFWEFGNSQANQQARQLLQSVSSIYNVHIMGWGSRNPWPAKDETFDFQSIQDRVNLTKSLGGEPWITFCTAPGWMKGTGDWQMERAPLPEFEDDFAYLCGEIAKAFPDVKVFQIWNEFKGMWSSGRIDHVRYTRLYNKVYTAVKAVRPDAVIGGFYAVLEGDGTHVTFGNLVGNEKHTSVPIISDERTAITYFLNNAIGVDLFLVDRSNVDYHNDGYWMYPDRFRPTRDQAMQLTKYFQIATGEVAKMTELPIVWSEYYGTYGNSNAAEYMPINSAYIGAHYASIIYNMIMGAGGREIYALLWLEKENDIRHALFTDTDKPGGGQPTPHYHAMKKLIDNFPKGTMLYTADIKVQGIEKNKINDSLEALVSDKAALLINKTNTNLNVTVNGTTYKLTPYAVEVFDIGR